MSISSDTGPPVPTAPFAPLDLLARIVIWITIIYNTLTILEAFYKPIQFLTLAVAISQLVLFLYWFHRAYKNLPALGATELQANPRWAVICWFIPILNIWRPYQIAVEILKSSDTSIGGTNAADRAALDRPTFFLVWWIFNFVAFGVGIGLTYGLRSAADLHIGNLTLDLPQLVAGLIGIIGTWLQISVIREITGRQTRKRELMNAGN